MDVDLTPILNWVQDNPGKLFWGLIYFVVGLWFLRIVLKLFRLANKDYSDKLKKAIINYVPISRIDPVVVKIKRSIFRFWKRAPKDSYVVDLRGAYLDGGSFIMETSKIENAMGIKQRILSIDPLPKAGYFQIELGEMPVKKTERGFLASDVDWQDLPFPDPKLPESKYIIPLGARKMQKKISPNNTFFHNWLTKPHILITGETDSGKSSILKWIISASSMVYPWFIIVVSLAKKTDWGLCQYDPNALDDLKRYNEQNAKSNGQVNTHTWLKKYPKLPNLFIIHTDSEFLAVIDELDRIRAYRDALLVRYPRSKSIYDLANDSEYLKEHKSVPFSIMLCIDDFSFLYETYGERTNVKKALNKVKSWVSLLRAYGIHIVFLTQGPQKTYFDSARDQLRILAVQTNALVNSWLLGLPVDAPQVKGAFAYREQSTFGRADLFSIKTACSSYLEDIQFAEIMAWSAENVFTDEHKEVALDIKVNCNPELQPEKFEKIVNYRLRFLNAREKQSKTTIKESELLKLEDNGKLQLEKVKE